MPNGGRVSLLVRWCTDATTPGSAVCVCVCVWEGEGAGQINNVLCKVRSIHEDKCALCPSIHSNK